MLYCILKYFSVLCLTGFCGLCLIYGRGKISVAESVLLAPALGCGILPSLHVFMSIAGIKPGPLTVLLPGMISAALLMPLAFRGRLPVFHGKEFKSAGTLFPLLLPLGAVATGVAVIAISALTFPLFDIDGFAIWGFKAKILLNESMRDTEYFRTLPLSFSHLDYPPLVPFLMNGVYALYGSADDSLGRLVFIPVYASMASLAFCCVMLKSRSVFQASAAAALTALLPPVIRWSLSGTADLTLTLFYGISVLYFVKSLETGSIRDTATAFIFTFFTAMTKNEGLPLAVINAAAFTGFHLAKNHDWKKTASTVLPYAAALGLLLLPWLLFRAGIPKTHENYIQHARIGVVIANIARIPLIIRAFTLESVNIFRWTFFWFLPVLALFANFKALRERAVQFLWVLFVLHGLLYVFVFVISPWETGYLLHMTLERLFLHMLPPALLIAEYHISPFIRNVSDSRESVTSTTK